MLRELPDRSLLGGQLRLDRHLPLSPLVRGLALLTGVGAIGGAIGCGGVPECASVLVIAGERLCLDGEARPLAVTASDEAPAGRWAGPFVCTDRGCEQREPPLPGDGEWECRDELGALVCRGGEPAAGIVEGPRDPAFDCAELEDGREVCVALDVRLPLDAARGHRCTIAHEHGPVRRCVADPLAPALLSHCDADHRCEGSLGCAAIAGGRCIPSPRSAHGCWIDADCGGASCVLGRCVR